MEVSRKYVVTIQELLAVAGDSRQYPQHSGLIRARRTPHFAWVCDGSSGASVVPAAPPAAGTPAGDVLPCDAKFKLQGIECLQVKVVT